MKMVMCLCHDVNGITCGVDLLGDPHGTTVCFLSERTNTFFTFFLSSSMMGAPLAKGLPSIHFKMVVVPKRMKGA